MYCIFISDAHLKGRDDINQERLIAFLEELTENSPDMLFLLGDIFDYWISPGGFIDPVYIPLVNALRRLSSNGVRLYYHIGNHDFFIKQTFETLFNVNIIEAGMDITIDGIKCHITHGDMIDYTDKKYRLLKFIIRSRPARKFAELLPAGMVKRAASGLSNLSRDVWTVRKTMPASVLDEYIQKKAADGFDAVIAAHFHKPEIRELIFNDKHIKYINTGNWFDAYSYIVMKNGKFELKYFNKK